MLSVLFPWCGPGSNRRHKDFQSFALPTELPHHQLACANGLQKYRFIGKKAKNTLFYATQHLICRFCSIFKQKLHLLKHLKYLNSFIFYVAAYVSFNSYGFASWTLLILSWIVIPGTELLIKPDNKNLAEAEENLAKADKLYDYMLHFVVVLQVATLFYFLRSMQDPNLSTWNVIARVGSMGMLCGIFGINVAHELGHRNNSYEQWLAKTLLLTSMYTHFFIEHNKGHHKNVATPQDPSSARYNEWVYAFYLRTISLTYVHAWKISNAEVKKKGKPFFSIHNEMLVLQTLQLLLIVIIGLVFSWVGIMYFLIAAFIGILLLETVNYIEHYGLQRKKTSETSYERALPKHSWNSNHVLGRIMLFELTRHSDHHYLASRKYQILKHHDEAPQLLTGYPGSMLLALVPPLWCALMNNQIKKLNLQTEQ
jgi:alkane 1-monooxygenase